MKRNYPHIAVVMEIEMVKHSLLSHPNHHLVSIAMVKSPEVTELLVQTEEMVQTA